MSNNVSKKSDETNRREFLKKVALGSVTGAGVLTFAGIVQLTIPRVLNEPASKFKIGFPTDYPLNAYKLIAERNVFVLNQPDGIRALSAICTHLGCIVAYSGTEFFCPCHGSKFDNLGNVMSGPAPKALEWLQVSASPDGQLVVDLNKKVSINDKFIV